MLSKKTLQLTSNNHQLIYNKYNSGTLEKAKAEELLDQTENKNLACQDCYPKDQETTSQFDNFWDAISKKGHIVDYTRVT